MILHDRQCGILDLLEILGPKNRDVGILTPKLKFLQKEPENCGVFQFIALQVFVTTTINYALTITVFLQ